MFEKKLYVPFTGEFAIIKKVYNGYKLIFRGNTYESESYADCVDKAMMLGEVHAQ